MKKLNKGKFTGTKKSTTTKPEATSPTGFSPFKKKVPGKPVAK